MPIMNHSQTATSSRRRSTRVGAATIAGVLCLGVGLSACDAVTEAADDARQAVEEGVGLAQYCIAAADLARSVNDEDLAGAVAAAEDMVEHAPAEIAPEAELLLAAAREAQDGDPSRLQSDEARQALDEVARFTQDRCDPR